MTTDGMFALYESHVVSGDGSLRPLSYLTGTSIEKKLRARAETEPCTFMHVLQHVVSGDGSLRPLSYLTGTSIEKKLRARAETEPCTFMHVLHSTRSISSV